MVDFHWNARIRSVDHSLIWLINLGLSSCRDKVVDLHWNASDPWTIVSASDDSGGTGGGGTLQVSFFIQILHSFCS